VVYVVRCCVASSTKEVIADSCSLVVDAIVLDKSVQKKKKKRKTT
jgi:hypothetical protein